MPAVLATKLPEIMLAKIESTAQQSAHLPVVDELIAAVTRRMQTQRLPTATYRVQFNARCTFCDVAQIVPYLRALGISDLYASPFLQARPGSQHGYDVVDPAALNTEIGSRDDLRSLRSALRESGMGLIADVVPNHMSASPTFNRWWMDVLENGPSSPYAPYFDIDWMPLKPDLADKVLLPILGEQFGKALEEGRLIVHFGEGTFWLEYEGHRFPIAPRSYSRVLSLRMDELRAELGAEHSGLLELLSILTAIHNLPPRSESAIEKLVERRREKEIIKRRLEALVNHFPPIAAFVTDNVRFINGQPGLPRSFDRLDQLLQDQAYRLADWRVAADEINYRRFFDINELAAICTEVPEVFAETHKLLFELLDEDTITGLRIDHPDGLYDPWNYLCQLQERHFLRLCRSEWQKLPPRSGTAPGTTPAPGSTDCDAFQDVERQLLQLWRATAKIPGSPLSRPLFLVVEKILARDELLPEDWPVHGTVGYEFLNSLNGLFVDRTAEWSLSSFYERFTGQSLDFTELAYRCKQLIVRMSMASELSVLGHRLDRISERNRWTRDFTLSSLTRALQEVVACFSIYRTYVQPERVQFRDGNYIELAVARAKRRNPAMNESIFDFVRDVLLLRHHENADDEERRAVESFAGKFQQLTGPIMARAIEDTAFYRFNRLVSLSEVGGEPASFGGSPAEFHNLNRSRLPRSPYTLNTTTTHDTKRSEDVRTRIDVLSEIPVAWREQVRKWSRWNRAYKTALEGIAAPSRNAEYMLYQTLIGIWPDEVPVGNERDQLCQRVQQCMLKVVREAKVHTSWVNPHLPYEQALADFIEGLFREDRPQPFLAEFADFARQVAIHGRWNSLSQVVLKITAPGVPDFYQGTESWNLTLVDPDNRQAVDLEARAAALDELLLELAQVYPGSHRDNIVETWISAVTVGRSSTGVPLDLKPRTGALLQQLLQTSASGRVKLFVTLLSLWARRRGGALFTTGEYLPLETIGRFADHIVAFARRDGDDWAFIIVPRLTVKVVGFGGPPPLSEAWEDTAVILPEAICTSGDQPRVFRELFAWRTIAGSVTVLPQVPSLPVKDVLRDFPVAILFS